MSKRLLMISRDEFKHIEVIVATSKSDFHLAPSDHRLYFCSLPYTYCCSMESTPPANGSSDCFTPFAHSSQDCVDAEVPADSIILFSTAEMKAARSLACFHVSAWDKSISTFLCSQALSAASLFSISLSLSCSAQYFSLCARSSFSFSARISKSATILIS